MRNIYFSNVINDFQQGVIINNCTSESYIDKSIFGIIITPRCDIENQKVKTIHYLPIVKFDDWIAVDYNECLKEVVEKDLRNKMSNILKNNNKSASILSLMKIRELRENIENLIKSPKEQKSFNIHLTELEELLTNSLSNDTLIKYTNSLGKTIIRELKENKKKEFYLIEDWEEKNNYCVVLLREVQRISFDLIKKISKGIFEEQISENEWKKNDLFKSNTSDNFFCPVAKLKSPYIEHLIQSFFHNFGRIGVENFEKNIEDNLLNETLKTY